MRFSSTSSALQPSFTTILSSHSVRSPRSRSFLMASITSSPRSRPTIRLSCAVLPRSKGSTTLKESSYSQLLSQFLVVDRSGLRNCTASVINSMFMSLLVSKVHGRSVHLSSKARGTTFSRRRGRTRGALQPTGISSPSRCTNLRLLAEDTSLGLNTLRPGVILTLPSLSLQLVTRRVQLTAVAISYSDQPCERINCNVNEGS